MYKCIDSKYKDPKDVRSFYIYTLLDRELFSFKFFNPAYEWIFFSEYRIYKKKPKREGDQ